MTETMTVNTDWKGSQQIYINGSAFDKSKLTELTTDFVAQQDQGAFRKYTSMQTNKPLCDRLILINSAFEQADTKMSLLQKIFRAVSSIFNGNGLRPTLKYLSSVALKYKESFTPIETILASERRNDFLGAFYAEIQAQNDQAITSQPLTELERQGLACALQRQEQMRQDPEWAEHHFNSYSIEELTQALARLTTPVPISA